MVEFKKAFPTKENSLPRSIINESQFPKIISFVQAGNCSLSANDNVNGTTEDYVPTLAFISLMKY